MPHFEVGNPFTRSLYEPIGPFELESILDIFDHRILSLHLAWFLVRRGQRGCDTQFQPNSLCRHPIRPRHEPWTFRGP